MMLKIKFSSVKAYELLLIWIWSLNFIARYIRAIVLKLPKINVVADWVIPCIMIFLVVFAGKHLI